jgi:hypothetical protein
MVIKDVFQNYPKLHYESSFVAKLIEKIPSKLIRE